MKAALDAAKEAKLIFKTDKRFWAAGGFLVAVILIWSMTTSWREEIPQKLREVEKPVKKEQISTEIVSSLMNDLKEKKEEREKIYAEVKRTANDFVRGKEEIDAHLDKLNDKLRDIGDKMDKMVADIGESKVRSEILQQNVIQKKSSKQ